MKLILLFCIVGWFVMKAGISRAHDADKFYRSRFIIDTKSDWTRLRITQGAEIVNAKFTLLKGEDAPDLSIKEHPVSESDETLDGVVIAINKRQYDETQVTISSDFVLRGLQSDVPLQFESTMGAMHCTRIETHNFNADKPKLLQSVVNQNQSGDWALKFSIPSEQLMTGGPLNAIRPAFDKIALAYYYIWFTPIWFEGKEPSAGDSMLDIHPVIGPYDSSDPNVIRTHVKMAKQAHLDAFAVSWWKAGRPNEILAKVIEIAGENELKITVDVEGLHRSIEEIYQMLLYYLKQYNNDERVLRINGKPVLLIWGTWQYSPEQWRTTFDKLKSQGYEGIYLPSEQMNKSYLHALDGLDVYGTINRKLAKLYQIGALACRTFGLLEKDAPPKIWSATICPGYDERLIPGRRGNLQERCDGDYYRSTFEAAIASDPDMLHINSFNELAEHSHIEPTVEYGDFYLKLTAEFVDEFKRPGNNIRAGRNQDE